ncbi:MAG TPA: MFS transporter [Anaerolineae bacterium]|nr:MFS transporter [Anaerolineae bacterium]
MALVQVENQVRSAANPATAAHPSRNVLHIRNFRLLWLGQGLSLLGDQFYMIALPWLVLRISGDPVVLGTVLALAGLPRALFMLVGGALTDRFSPRRIMLLSDSARLMLTISLAVLVLASTIELWMIYLFALLFGTVAGFFIPASNAILPQLVPPEKLQSGNAIFQGTAQLSLFLGPAIAGGLIALFSGPAAEAAQSASGLLGIAVAFGVDALTFLVSIVTLSLMNVDRPQRSAGSAGTATNVFAAIKAGLSYAIHDPALRVLGVLIAALNCLFLGPTLIGIPVLADQLPGGAAALGLMVSAQGGGTLLGIILAGAARRPKALGLTISATVAGFGFGLIALGIVSSVLAAALVLFVVGIGSGYLNVFLITFLQRRAPKEMLGRLMSLVMFASIGLIPISQAISGVLIKFSFTALFVGAGSLMIVIALWTAVSPAMRMISSEVTASDASATSAA